MTRRVSRVTPIRYGLLLLAAWLATGCVILPYKPGAEIADTTGVELDPALVRLSALGRPLLEEVSNAIRRQDSAITVVDPQIFADAAFLDDDVRLSRLLTAPACARVREQTAVDYLVLVGTPQTVIGETQGFMSLPGKPYRGAASLVFLGAAKRTETVSNLADIFDLKTAMPLCRVSSKAEGYRLGVGAVYGLFVVPLTEWGAMDGLARGVVARLREVAGPDPLTIAVMGADPVPEPEPEPEPEPVPEKARAAPTVAAVTGDAIEWPRPSQHVIAARAEKPRFKSEPGPEPASSKEEALIRSIQEGLRRVGYTWVPVDGRLGSWTRAAIRDFQSSPEWAGRIADEMPSVHLLVDIERAIPKWDAVLQPPLQPADAEQK